LIGNQVTLEKLTDNEALVRLKSIYFLLYKQISHLRDQISPDDYRRLFETIWQDRAEQADWHLTITYSGEECIFHFSRKKYTLGWPFNSWPTGKAAV
jgi:hypothetical protein